MVQVDVVTDACSPPGEYAEVGPATIAGTEALTNDHGSRSGPWFRCRDVGIAIESADSQYATTAARSVVDILSC